MMQSIKLLNNIRQHWNPSFQKLPDKKNISGSAVTTQPDTGHVAVVTGVLVVSVLISVKALPDMGIRSLQPTFLLKQNAPFEWQKERLEEGLDIHIIECEVKNYRACKKMAKELEEKHNRVDILVNCAGITRDATLKKMEKENWHAVLETSLDSVFNVTRSFINGMVKRRYGRIINISSVNGLKGQFGQTN